MQAFISSMMSNLSTRTTERRNSDEEEQKENDEYHFTLTYNLSEYSTKRIFFDRFRMISQIGHGSQAYIKSAYDCMRSNNVAMKIFKK